MAAEQIQRFRNGLLQFECDGETFNTLKTNFENAVNGLPAELHSASISNQVLKRRIIGGFRSFINQNISDFVQHGNIMGGNFTEWLEELAAQVVPDNQANNAIRVWDTHFSPLVDMYESMAECISEYHDEVWAANNNANNIPNNENPAAPAQNAPAAVPAADPVAPPPNAPAPAAGGRRSSRKSRRNSNRKSRRNNSRRAKRNTRR